MKKKAMKVISTLLFVSMLVGHMPIKAMASPVGIDINWWIVDSMDKVMSNSTLPQNPMKKISIDMVRGEYESSQIALRSNEGFFVENVEFTDLTNGNDILSKDNLTYRFMDFENKTLGYAKIGKTTQNFPKQKYPDPISNDKTRIVQNDLTQPIYVQAYIPENMNPGTYSGKAKVKTNLGDIEVPIAITVYNVTLRKTAEMDYTMYNWASEVGFSFLMEWDSPKQYYNLDRYSAKWWDLMNDWADNMISHRQNMFCVNTPILLMDGGTTVDQDGTCHFDFTRFDQYIDMLIAKGFNKFGGMHLAFHWDGHDVNKYPGPGMSGMLVRRNYDGEDGVNVGETGKAGETIWRGRDIFGSETNNFMKQYLPALAEHLYMKKLPDGTRLIDVWYQHVFDECNYSSNGYNKWMHLRDLVHEYGVVKDENNNIIAGMKTWDADASGGMKQYKDKVNIWVPELSMYENDPFYDQQKNDEGDMIYGYVCVVPHAPYLNRFYTQPIYAMEYLQWFGFRHNLDGILNWAWNVWQQGNLIGDNCLVYPDKENNTVLSSYRNETMRDSLENYDLLTKAADNYGKAIADGFVDELITTGINYVTDATTFRDVRHRLILAAEGNMAGDNVDISPTGVTIVKGSIQDESFAITAQGNPVLNAVYLNGVELDDSQATIGNNSLTLKGEYLKNLQEGEYIFTLDFNNNVDRVVSVSVKDKNQKAKLIRLIKEATLLNSADFSNDTYTVLLQAKQQAITVNNNSNASEDEIANAISGLSQAISNLEAAVLDTVAPVLTVDPINVSLKVGEKFDAFAGVTANDGVDGDVGANIVVTGEVDTTKAGNYTVTYKAVDKADNEVQVVRTITVLELSKEEVEAKLRELVKECENKFSFEYTSTSWNRFSIALVEAKNELNKDNATAESLNLAYEKLDIARILLVAVDISYISSQEYIVDNLANTIYITNGASYDDFIANIELVSDQLTINIMDGDTNLGSGDNVFNGCNAKITYADKVITYKIEQYNPVDSYNFHSDTVPNKQGPVWFAECVSDEKIERLPWYEPWKCWKYNSNNTVVSNEGPDRRDCDFVLSQSGFDAQITWLAHRDGTVNLSCAAPIEFEISGQTQGAVNIYIKKNGGDNLIQGETRLGYDDADGKLPVDSITIEVKKGDKISFGSTISEPIFSASIKMTPIVNYTISKAELEILYNNNIGKVEEEYTSETWAPFSQAIVAAKTVIDENDPTCGQIKQAYNNLVNAVNALVKIKDNYNYISDFVFDQQGPIWYAEYVDSSGIAKEMWWCTDYGADTWKGDGTGNTWIDAIDTTGFIVPRNDCDAQITWKAPKSGRVRLSFLNDITFENDGSSTTLYIMKNEGNDLTNGAYSMSNSGDSMTVTPLIIDVQKGDRISIGLKGDTPVRITPIVDYVNP